MRPEILYPLFAPVTTLKGVGTRFGALIERAAGARVVDLLWHLPTGIIDRRLIPSIAEAIPGGTVTLSVRIDSHFPPSRPRLPYRVLCSDGSGTLMLVFFHTRGGWIEASLPVGAHRIVSGKLESFGGQLQMSHPDHVLAADAAPPAVEPVYPLTEGLTLRMMGRAAAAALGRAPDLGEWLDRAMLQQREWPSWRQALETIHGARSMADLAIDHPARLRLAYDELLSDQLALALIRDSNRRQSGRKITGDGRLTSQLTATLPFQLTSAQLQALSEIAGDMAAPSRMMRLLQGDVGSGKTIVALMAMLIAVESGAQAALMAPTEILARQHAATLNRFLGPIGVPVGLLTGRDRGAGRDSMLSGLADGSIPIVVGTHALFQKGVTFHNLALAVIDEQHRFGVEQRVQLTSKDIGVDVLVMTATPIPRSLMLTSYGDLDASYLRDKPAGRQKIATSLVRVERLDEVVAAVGRSLEQNKKIYWVCPLIDESEALDVAAAEQRFAALSLIFGERAALLHGRMKPAERDRVMMDFAKGSVDLLVATTVIEVGVDVPEATVMVIEHAERFGLAQLHQLRGRIGRGSEASSCVLLYAGPLSETAEARLKILRETEDGFRIAEEDLRLRGAGEVLGTRQSGMPGFKIADLAAHQELLHMAYDDTRLILNRDPDLAGERGRQLRVLLYLFARDSAIRYLHGG